MVEPLNGRRGVLKIASDGSRRAAIIDIGSNSLRLVVYAGPARAPQPIFNEKLMVGLGSGLATSGAIEQRAFDRAIKGLARFKALVEAMEFTDLRCVATAAVRERLNLSRRARASSSKPIPHICSTLA